MNNDISTFGVSVATVGVAFGTFSVLKGYVLQDSPLTLLLIIFFSLITLGVLVIGIRKFIRNENSTFRDFLLKYTLQILKYLAVLLFVILLIFFGFWIGRVTTFNVPFMDSIQDSTVVLPPIDTSNQSTKEESLKKSTKDPKFKPPTRPASLVTGDKFYLYVGMINNGNWTKSKFPEIASKGNIFKSTVFPRFIKGSFENQFNMYSSRDNNSASEYVAYDITLLPIRQKFDTICENLRCKVWLEVQVK